MEELIVLAIQFVAELMFDIFAAGVSSTSRRRSVLDEPDGIVGRCFLWLLGGCVVGLVSALIFTEAWLKFAPLRIANLVLAPIIAAYISQAIAQWRADRGGYDIIPRNHFWQAFWFALGMVGVRFTYLALH